MGPPSSQKSEIAKIIAKKYNICYISVTDLLNNEIRAQNENSSNILSSMNTGDLVSDKFVLKLIEDRLYASDCMINGWILTGFPKNAAQLNFLIESSNGLFKPSLIAVIDLDDDLVERRSNLRRIDPATGKIYFTDAPYFERLSSDVVKRLISKNEDKPDIFKKRLDNFKKIPNFPENLDNVILRLNGEAGIDNMIERISDAMENATI